MKKYRLGIIGLSPGNGHPYSWSAIFNGYDRKEMVKCPFPMIPAYLDKQDPATMYIKEGRVTHIWTQDPKISKQVARASLIENVAENMTGLIGKVDAIILARDDGENHLKMAKPFIDAGIPILIDKPLTDREDDLKEFVRYYQAGKPIMSCSSMRYEPSILDVKENKDIGRILTASAVIQKYWRTYGIHIIDAVYAVMGAGVESVQNVGRTGEEIVHLDYADGRHAVVQTFARIGKGSITFYGEKEPATVAAGAPNAFFQFKNMLQNFIKMLDTGKSPVDWQETVETIKVVIAGQRSLEERGRRVTLSEIG